MAFLLVVVGWLIMGGGWLVGGGWWLVVGGWWLVVGVGVGASEAPDRFGISFMEILACHGSNTCAEVAARTGRWLTT